MINSPKNIAETAEVHEGLSEMFDRYSAALDAGDDLAAERILSQQPGIGDEYREPIRGLYLLGLAADTQWQQKRENEGINPSTADGKTKRLGDFEIQYELGRGGMGIVYAANQISLQRQVALKVLPFAAVLDPRQVTRFQNEARAAASLHHPNIVPVYGVGCERGVHFYSMQLVHGQTLAQFIDQIKEQPFEELIGAAADAETERYEGLNTVHDIESDNYIKRIVELGITVAEAINFAHEEGIVHRDIKPSNILLDQAGKVWVTDFGLARGREPSNLTTQGGQLGTLRYMSPEQASGRQHAVDYRTDIYSLGISLCELLTLKPAFESNGKLKLIEQIESAQPQRLRSLNRLVSNDLETVINKSIAKLPAQRYQSGKEFADDLRRCLEGKAILAKPKSVLDRCVDVVDKNRRVVSFCVLGLIVLTLAAVTLASVFYHQRHREQQSVENARVFLQQSHKSVNRFGILLEDELSKGPMTESLRRQLLVEAAGYYDDFLAYSEHDSQLKSDRAQAFAQSADLYERMGNDLEARARRQKAIAAWEYAEASPHEKHQQLICFNKLGMLHKRSGDFAAATVAYDAAIGGFASLDQSQRKRPDVLATEAQAYSNLAMLRWAQAELDAAISDFQTALRILNRCEDSGSSDEHQELRKIKLRINGNYYSLLAEVGGGQAEDALRDTITNLEEAIASHSGSSHATLRTDSARQLADLQNNLAIILSKKGSLSEAETLVSRVIEFWQQETRKPNGQFDMEAHLHLATTYNTMGEVRWRQKRDQLADEAFAQAETLLRKIADRESPPTDVLSRMGGVLHNRSLVNHRRGDLKSAADQMKQALAFQNRAAKLSPDNGQYASLLQTHRRALAVFTKDGHEN